jgi:hypothetical protein
MLFLLRPRQTAMPYRLPRNRTQQGAYNRELRDRFNATRQVAEPAAAVAPGAADPLDQVQALAVLHDAGTLTDEEFAAAKSRVLGP